MYTDEQIAAICDADRYASRHLTGSERSHDIDTIELAGVHRAPVTTPVAAPRPPAHRATGRHLCLAGVLTPYSGAALRVVLRATRPAA